MPLKDVGYALPDGTAVTAVVLGMYGLVDCDEPNTSVLATTVRHAVAARKEVRNTLTADAQSQPNVLDMGYWCAEYRMYNPATKTTCTVFHRIGARGRIGGVGRPVTGMPVSMSHMQTHGVIDKAYWLQQDLQRIHRAESRRDLRDLLLPDFRFARERVVGVRVYLCLMPRSPTRTPRTTARPAQAAQGRRVGVQDPRRGAARHQGRAGAPDAQASRREPRRRA